MNSGIAIKNNLPTPLSLSFVNNFLAGRFWIVGHSLALEGRLGDVDPSNVAPNFLVEAGANYFRNRIFNGNDIQRVVSESDFIKLLIDSSLADNEDEAYDFSRLIRDTQREKRKYERGLGSPVLVGFPIRDRKLLVFETDKDRTDKLIYKLSLVAYDSN